MSEANANFTFLLLMLVHVSLRLWSVTVLAWPSSLTPNQCKQRRRTLKNLSILIAASTIFSGAAFADGHSLWPAVGFQTPTSTDMMEGKTGNIMHLTSNDVWDYAQAPEGWPKMVTATCHNSVLFLPDGGVAGGVGVCESIDPDGDASVWYGEISPTFGYDGKLVAGTGKYEKMVGAKFDGQVTGQMADGSAIYHVKPK